MSKDILKIEDYPIPKVLDPESELDEGWVDTLPETGIEPKKLVALDCEMVRHFPLLSNEKKRLTECTV